jgi:predicted GNAT superfamily acetyltransferase
MQIRPLTTLDECRQVAALEKLVWGLPDPEDVVPPAVLIVSIKRGGILLGAFDETGSMVGFVYSLAGLKDARPMQWSHLLGVVPAARDSGVGRALKLAQRTAAIEMGLDLIEWTFDPLQARNAHFNFARLGVVVEHYEEDVYGASSSPLHQGAPTDRFIAEWRITTPHVERRIASAGQPMVRDARVMAAPVVNPSSERESRLVPGTADISSDAPRILVEIPMGFDEMLVNDSTLALEWRLSTRLIFESYFRRGYRAVDFLLSRSAGRGQYLLSLPVPSRTPAGSPPVEFEPLA